MAISPSVIKWTSTVLRWSTGALAYIGGVIGAELLPFGAAMQALEWLRSPIVFVPLIIMGTILVWYDVLKWLVDREVRLNNAPARDWPMRDFVRYLARDAAVAYEFDDYRVWDEIVAGRLEDDFADERKVLTVWGRASGTGLEAGKLGVTERLEPHYWRDNRLDWHSCVSRQYPWAAHTWVNLSKTPRFDLWVNKRQAMGRFPRAPWFQRMMFKSPIADRPPQKIIIREHDELHVWESLDGLSQTTTVKPRSSAADQCASTRNNGQHHLT